MGSQVLNPKSLEVNMCKSLSLRAWKLGLITSHGVPSPKYDMDVYTATLYGGEARDLC